MAQPLFKNAEINDSCYEIAAVVVSLDFDVVLNVRMVNISMLEPVLKRERERKKRKRIDVYIANLDASAD